MRIVFSFFCSLLTLSTLAQSVEISGTVTDENGEGLPGTSIIIEGTSKGTVTDIAGFYQLSAESGDVFVFSFLGYESQKKIINEAQTLNVQMLPSIEALDEIVVIGYGAQKKSDLTGSISTLDASSVELQPVQRVEGMLQGKVAGVAVTQGNGAPGSAPRVNIRGFTGDPVYVIDGFIGGDINALNPNDIETISILKDASATAIYGSRGANGVVLIQTKNAKTDRVKIDIDYYHTVSELRQKVDLLDPLTYMQVINEKAEEGGSLPVFSGEDLAMAGQPEFGTDWQDEIFRTAHSDNLQIAISKGNEKGGYRFSFGGRQDQGIITNSGYERYNLRFNFNSELSPTTKMNFNITGAYEELQNTFRGGNRADGSNEVIASALAWSPNLPVFDPATGDYQGFVGYGATVLDNPVYLANEIDQIQTNYVAQGNISIEQEIGKDLNARFFLAGQVINGLRNEFQRFRPANIGSVSETFTADQIDTRWQSNLQLTYKKSIADFHNLDFLVVAEMQQFLNKRFGFVTSSPTSNQLDIFNQSISNLIAFPGNRQDAGRFEPERMISYLSRAGYNYKGKLFLNASLRVDGSSRLPEGNRYQSFFSTALAYHLGDENFMSTISFLDDLKLRIGYGETGNVESLRAFQVQDITNSIRPYRFDESTPSAAIGFEDGNDRANPELLWETSRQTNFGVDFVFFDGKLNLSTDYYIKFTDDLHFREQVVQFLGNGSVTTNSGQYRNNGFEFQLGTELKAGDFEFDLSLNASILRSEVTELPTDSLRLGNAGPGFDAPSHLLIEGQEIGQLAGYQYLGTKTTEDGIPGGVNNVVIGDAVYADLDGDGLLTTNDIGVIGNGYPEFVWGFNGNVTYKDFSINIFVQGVHGVDTYNLPLHGLYGGGSGVLDATSVDILDSYSFNRSGSLPGLNANFRQGSSLFLEDGGFVRINNVTLAYNASSETIPFLPFDRMRIYAGVQNLAVFTNYSGFDPETKSGSGNTPGLDFGSFPIPRSYTFGINFNF
ncbi:MAG: TonB-dependent receptor [Bacteroidota bacterium]